MKRGLSRDTLGVNVALDVDPATILEQLRSAGLEVVQMSAVEQNRSVEAVATRAEPGGGTTKPRAKPRARRKRA